MTGVYSGIQWTIFVKTFDTPPLLSSAPIPLPALPAEALFLKMTK